MASSASRVIHVRATLKGPTDVLLASLLDGLRDKEFDVLGSRLRFALRESSSGPEREKWRTLDIFLRLTGKLLSLTAAQLKTLVNEIGLTVVRSTQSDLILGVTEDDEDSRDLSQGSQAQAGPVDSPGPPGQANG
jgi:hypothetical protein